MCVVVVSGVGGVSESESDRQDTRAQGTGKPLERRLGQAE